MVVVVVVGDSVPKVWRGAQGIRHVFCTGGGGRSVSALRFGGDEILSGYG